jgi:2-dehydropantoate 2-reductase
MDQSIIFTIGGHRMMTTNPIWHIAGIGALGSLFAGRFCNAGLTVQLILKNEQQLINYQQSALTLIDNAHVFSCQPPATIIERLDNQPIKYLICCVKSYDSTTLLMQLRHRLNEESIIILIHNGLGVIDEIKTNLPHLRLISGITTIGAYLEKSFTVRAFLDGKTHLGAVVGQFTTHEIERICSVFQESKLPYQWEENISTMMWEKFALNCSINILTAVFNCKNGDLLMHVELLKQMTQEIAEIINAYNIMMTADDLFFKVTHLLKKVANNYSSMYKDVNNKKPTELEYLNKHLMKLAQQKNIATPINIEIVQQFNDRFL